MVPSVDALPPVGVKKTHHAHREDVTMKSSSFEPAVHNNLTQRKNPRVRQRSSLNTERSERFYLVVTKISLSPPRPKDTEAGERVRNVSREAWCWNRTNTLGVRQQRECNRQNQFMSEGLRISLKQGIHPKNVNDSLTINHTQRRKGYGLLSESSVTFLMLCWTQTLCWSSSCSLTARSSSSAFRSISLSAISLVLQPGPTPLRAQTQARVGVETVIRADRHRSDFVLHFLHALFLDECLRTAFFFFF